MEMPYGNGELTLRQYCRARSPLEAETRVRIPLGKETRGTQAASATPSMLNVSDAFQPSEQPPGVTTLILKGVFALEF